jgi:glycosyltransferase involved in cell wall biosynthesis
MTAESFSLQRFEILAYARKRDEAIKEFDKLLRLLETNYGELRGADFGPLPAGSRDHDATVLARLASALTALLIDPTAAITPQGFAQIVSWQRWIPAIFAASPFASTDHVLRALNLDGTSQEIRLDWERLLRFCLFYGPESEVPLDIEKLWAFDKRLAATLAFVLMSPRLLASPEAHAKREVLLRFLPPRLEELGDIDLLPWGILHDVYMQCSYADGPNRHDIKAPINRLIRKKLLSQGLPDLDVTTPRGEVNGKPVLLVVVEWFTANHSVYRTHSASLRGLRERFHVIGLAHERGVDETSRTAFDELIVLPEDGRRALDLVRETAAARRPAIVYYPSIGMFPLTIFLSNLRLAPRQVTAIGHAATSRAETIDHYVVDEDFVGDLATLSETPIVMPPDGMPHVPSIWAKPVEPVLREAPEVVRIGIASSIMKFNPRFLETLRTIVEKSTIPLQLVFLPGFARGVLYVQVRNVIWRYLPGAIVHSEQPYEDYIAILNDCDMLLNPFPYGNMNGIADMADLGLVGVCLSGPSISEHIDEGMFKRLGLPDWLVARTTEEYVAAALRLAANHAERLALRRDLLARDAGQVFYRGRAELLGEKFKELMG